MFFWAFFFGRGSRDGLGLLDFFSRAFYALLRRTRFSFLVLMESFPSSTSSLPLFKAEDRGEKASQLAPLEFVAILVDGPFVAAPPAPAGISILFVASAGVQFAVDCFILAAFLATVFLSHFRHLAGGLVLLIFPP